MSDNKQLLTRKEISQVTGYSVWILTVNEQRLGMIPFKIVVNSRVIRYRPEVLQVLARTSQVNMNFQ